MKPRKSRGSAVAASLAHTYDFTKANYGSFFASNAFGYKYRTIQINEIVRMSADVMEMLA